MSNIQNYITRQNYEEWFIDYLDGQMDPEREFQLFEFLNHNSDLKAELESMCSFAMPAAETVHFPDKHRLFMKAEAGMEFPEIDYLLIKQLEEGLSEGEQVRLTELTHQYPGLKKDEVLYSQTRLNPLAIAYPRKKSLIRRRAGWIWPASQAVAAAVLIAVLLIPGKESYQVEYPDQEFTALSQPVQTEVAVGQLHESANTVETVVPKTIKNTEVVTAPLTPGQVKPVTEQPDAEIINKMAPAPLITNRPIQLVTDPIQVDAYEAGLATMIPTYIDNQRLQDVTELVAEEPVVASSSVFERGTEFLSDLAQKDLGIRKIFDEEGKVVAVNVKSGHFELSQRLPRLFRR